ncbi:ORF MSV222 hypothetical protein [Melanoplus sanguinipes entomopoxvirus]|uniref:Uncharacterized protein n=1 Tax=Melanoplus sanguinipes entomopoxvirus TaxID=83191 RepID=Q9YVM0_MSEPV|nr:ORF MSV222 hypothetical protein [Melanoplus sanguinipes entomopoxvirus]AAC97707.1 ORF MSV222 hypothetical protein [Melanoplus sanguinipes entomopoxvirus 'O']
MELKNKNISIENFRILDGILHSTILDIVVSIFGIIFISNYPNIINFRYDYSILYGMCFLNAFISTYYMYALYRKNIFGIIMYIFWHFIVIFILLCILIINASFLINNPTILDLIKIILFWFITKQKLDYTFLIITHYNKMTDNDLPPPYTEVENNKY